VYADAAQELLEACEIERNSMVEQLLSQKKVQADLIERMDALAHKVKHLAWVWCMYAVCLLLEVFSIRQVFNRALKEP
jgi:hypothetical protein